MSVFWFCRGRLFKKRLRLKSGCIDLAGAVRRMSMLACVVEGFGSACLRLVGSDGTVRSWI